MKRWRFIISQESLVLQRSNKTGAVFHELLALCLSILICISGIYYLPYADVQPATVVHAKRIFYAFIMTMLAIQTWQGGLSNQNKLFSNACCALLLLILLNVSTRLEFYDEYLYVAASIGFIWLFVSCIQSVEFPVERFFSYLRTGVTLVNVAALFLVVLCLAGIKEVWYLVNTGFNDNRVNFSIWLSQLVFLNFFLVRSSPRVVGPLFFSFVLLAIQVFTGGRIGVLATLAVMFFFLPKLLAGKGRVLMAGIGILIFVVAASYYAEAQKASIGIGSGGDESIFRGLAEYRQTSDLLSYLDLISSHRVQITLTALKSIDIRTLLVGNGIGHSDVAVDTGVWMIHNIFLKLLVELGIAALLVFIFLFALPFAGKSKRVGYMHELHLMLLIGIGIGLLQPRFLVTGLSNCLIMWLCYGLILRAENAEKNQNLHLLRET